MTTKRSRTKRIATNGAQKPRRIRADAGDRWRQILAAATAEFLAKGYVGASMRDVSRRVGLLKGSLYHYIDSKEDLLFHVLRDLHESAKPLVERCRNSRAAPLLRLQQFIGELAPYAAEHAAQSMIFMRDFHFLPAARRRLIVAQRDLHSELMRELIEEARARGHIPRSIDPSLAAATLMGAIAFNSNWYRQSGRYTPQEIGAHQVTLLLAALRPTARARTALGAQPG